MAEKEIFQCRQCGWCCRGEGGIFITEDQAAGPAAILGIPTETFIAEYTRPRHGYLMLVTDEDGYCRAHDRENHTCRIHAAKPQMCRDWPFFYGPLADRGGFESARQACPGINPDIEWEDFVRWHRENIGVMPPRSYIFQEPDPGDKR